MSNNKIIIMNKASGDCEIFSSIAELCHILNIEECELKKLKQNLKFKEKYIFFCFESDLLRYKL